jgi:glyoxylase-like metal-dependent hydrolase (beta-lactamase superfamily II)
MRILALNFAIVLLALPAMAIAQPSQPAMPPAMLAIMNKPISVMPLRGGAFWVSGGVSTAGFVIGDKGVVAIDAQTFVPVAIRERAEIAKLTPKPVNVMILTHSDPDHINGLPGWPRGMEIIAQVNAKREMELAVTDPRSNGLPPPPEIKDYMPTRTIDGTERMTLDGVPMVLIHVGPAHTDGDIVVYLPKQRIVFAGDLITPEVGLYPGLHLPKHGSSLGWIEAMKAVLALDADLYVSGHGEMLTKAVLRDRLLLTEKRRADIAAMVAKGMTLPQIKAVFNDPPATGVAARFPSFTEAVYQELTEGEAPAHP